MHSHNCNKIGVPIDPHKTVTPTITFLGIELDSINMVACLPIEKKNKYTDEIDSFLNKGKITFRELKIINWYA